MRELIVLTSTYFAQNPVSASQDLLSKFNGIVNKMRVVTIQSLIYYLSQNRKYYMELHTFHVTPLFSTCGCALSENLKRHSLTAKLQHWASAALIRDQCQGQFPHAKMFSPPRPNLSKVLSTSTVSLMKCILH
jgi:hypothetical protein